MVGSRRPALHPDLATRLGPVHAQSPDKLAEARGGEGGRGRRRRTRRRRRGRRKRRNTSVEN